jgi:DnaD/phage-associated family protein
MRTRLVYLPDSFFTQLLSKFRSLSELQTVLYVVYLLQRKESSVKHVTYKELLSSQPLAALGEDLRQALDLAVNDGLLLRSVAEVDGASEPIYSLPPYLCESGAANIFALYEQNIGIITPMIAEELKEAASLYPPEWIEEAFREAVMLNKRSWRYILRILERWASEGKNSGEHKGDVKKGSPDKYTKGRYGHLVRR